MKIQNMPYCCTSAVLGSLGEHGEPSVVTVDTIKELVGMKAQPVYEDAKGERILVDNGKRCIFATSVDPRNIMQLKAAGFKEVDSYEGIQGTVHILTLHD